MKKDNLNLELDIFKEEHTSYGDYIYKQMNGVCLYVVLDEKGITMRLEDIDLDYKNKIVSNNSSLEEFRMYYLNKMIEKGKVEVD